MASTPTFSSKLGDLATLPELSDLTSKPTFEDPLASLDAPEGTHVIECHKVIAQIPSKKGVFAVQGVRGGAGAFLAHRINKQTGRKVVYVCQDSELAQKVTADLACFSGSNDSVLPFVTYEASPYADVNPDRRAALARLSVLHRLAVGPDWRHLVLPAAALVRKFIPKKVVQESSAVIAVDTEIQRESLLNQLVCAGYLRVPVVEDPGSFAVRGAVLDIWPPSAPEPVRIELYGDLVLSMKSFEPEGQRTIAELKQVLLAPAREAVLTQNAVRRAREQVQHLCDSLDMPSTKARVLVDDVISARAFFGAEGFLPAFYELDSLFSYIPNDAVVLIEDPPAIINAVRDELGRAMADESEKSSVPHFDRSELYSTEFDLIDQLLEMTVVTQHRTVTQGVQSEDLEQFENAPEDCPSLDARTNEDLERAVKLARTSKGKTATLDPLVRRLHHWTASGLSAILAARAETQAERLTALLRHAGVTCKTSFGVSIDDLMSQRGREPTITIITGPLARGCILPAEGMVFVTEEEVFGARAHRRQQKERKAKGAKPFLEDLRALNVGDYVVHVEHGIGKYLGLVHRELAGHTVDLLCVEYLGGKLYLPVYRLNQIQKFSGGDGAPKIDRLGGSTFAKTKAKVEKQVRQMADELLRLYAERQTSECEPMPTLDDDYQGFEATFPFDETPDQAQAINDVHRDLDSSKPMDRLVCGDVGFGKTEVAIRAAFRVAMAGKQVAVLCPTTVLAQQHYLSFEARFRDYPIRVAAMSRFQTKAEQDAVVRDIKDGKVDVVIGTHRLLSKDIHFKKLGLLVVDEEQRFGVTHKERIKQMRRNIDVLTLSATPIPRTLQMAVSGLRDMSLITTAPVDRRAIRTIVSRSDDAVLREAIRRELSRGGQVFFVYNRVDGLYERAAKIQHLVPEARVIVAHGQMGEVALEQAMIDFIDGRFDILCATAIIESGLDIPRANTMIIDRADMFGLAQLYQLRGRVGRSKERAYCYLIVPPATAMTDDARARIEALERHTELGSGFQIASLDLELRGAGDLLGAEQSGTASLVGFDLFCQMLEDAVRQLRGDEVVHEVEPELNFDVDALLPETYIDEVGVRLSLYKRLASATDEPEVQEIAAEMEDRFGPPPEEAKNLVAVMRIKTELRTIRVLGCESSSKSVTLHLREDTPLDDQKVKSLILKKGSPYRLTPDMKLSRRFSDGEVKNGLEAAEATLDELMKCRRADA